MGVENYQLVKMMNLPIPAMMTDKFCGCLELGTGLRVLSLVYAGFWVFYAVLEIVLGKTYLEMLHYIMPESIEFIVSITWCAISALAYLLVVAGMQIDNRMLLLPGIIMSLGNVVICLLQAVLNIITIIGIFSGIAGVVYAVFLAYYTVCLKALYDKMGASAPPPPMEGQQQFDQV